MATIVVITAEGLIFETEGNRWEPASLRREDGGIQLVVSVFEPAGAQPIAEFNDVHAVYFKNKTKLLPPEDE